MKITEIEEENNENRKVEIIGLDGTDESEGSGNTSDTKITFGKGELPEDPLDSGDVVVETDQDHGKTEVPAVTTPRGRGRPRKSPLVSDSVSPLAKVPAVTPRGRGRPRKSPLVSDAVSPLAEVPAATTPRGRGRPRKSTLLSDAVNPLAEVSATPSRGRGRPRKDASEIVKSPLTKDSPLQSEVRGKGKPKKIVDSSDVIETLEKPDDEKENVDVADLMEKDSPLQLERRGRGRPKKKVDTPDVIKTLEKPDDEKENVDVTDLKEKADSVPRRGRGRPRKNFGSFSASTSLTEGKAISTPRRGRGRPRKNFKSIGGTPLSKGRIGHQNDFKRFGAIQLLAQALAKHGRGRPPKGAGIKDAVQLLQKDPVLSKPGRGRPPKSIKRMFAMKLLAKAMAIGCQDEASKSISITDVTKVLKAAGTSRRGRGRPRKIVAVTTGPTSEKDAPAVTPRGRGRPRKNPETPDSSLVSGKAPAATPVTPRGRGRPRKNPPIVVDTAVLSSKVTEPVTGSSENVESMSEDCLIKTPENSHTVTL